MKNKRKPDLLVILVAILSLGVAASVVGENHSPNEVLQATQR